MACAVVVFGLEAGDGLRYSGDGRVNVQPLVSVIVPVYNEEKTLHEVLSRLERLVERLNLEIIVVDDGSTDGTERIARSFQLVTLVSHGRNLGKGAAIATGLRRSRGKVIVVQDADLEYRPEEIPRIVQPILEHAGDVVYGSRFLGECEGMSGSHRIGNLILSLSASVLFQRRITDVMTGHKAFRRGAIEPLSLDEQGFAIEVELTGKLARNGCKFVEVPIRYRYRRKGLSKITFKDGFACLFTMLRSRFLDGQ